jgi:DNA polymerase-1
MTALFKDIKSADATLYRDTGYTKVWLDGEVEPDLHTRLAAVTPAVLTAITPTVAADDRATVDALLAGYEVTLVTSTPVARAAVYRLLADADDGPVALDTETMVLPEYRGPVPIAINKDGSIAKRQPKDGAAGYALDPRRARVRLLQAHAGGRAIYLFDMSAVSWDAVAPLLKGDVALFNAVFDIKMILASGGPEPAGRVFDTMTTMRLLEPCERYPVGMEEAARLLLDTKVPKGLGAADWSGELTEDMRRYAAVDALVTYRLWQAQQQEMTEADRAAQAITDECLLATARMELAGMPHDGDAHHAFIAAVTEEAATAQQALVAATGLPPTPTDTEVRAWLASALDDEALMDWPTTGKTGALAVNRIALTQTAAAGVPGVPELLAVRRWGKALSTYGEPLLRHVADDSRLYARFLVAGARSGRYSSREPNLQNLPKRGRHELLAGFRRIIRAPEGRRILAADYGQIELRIMAEVSGDETMCAAFAAGDDVHMAMARNLAGGDWEALDDAERKRARSLAKSANFGLIYGSGPAAFARSATANGTPLSTEEAAAIIATWRETYPGIHEWQQEQTWRCRQDGYVQTVGGRRWWFDWRARPWDDPMLDELEDYQVDDYVRGFERNYSLNHPVQGTAAEVIAIALSYADRALRDYPARIIAVVHDELVVEADTDAADAVADVLQTEMTRAWQDFFPEAPTTGLVDVGGGPTWADAH